ncbi:MAG: c-type cytochrome [Nitrospinota bacterium]
MKLGWGLIAGIVGVAGSTALILSLVQGIPIQQDRYQPNTASGSVIFLQACARCHGAKGEGTALAVPLKGRKIPPERVQAQVSSGAERMPRFPNITGEALKSLSEFVRDL